MQQSSMYMYTLMKLYSSMKKHSLTKFVVVSAKSLKQAKGLPKILFNIDIIDPLLLLCFSILFKRRLQRFTTEFMSEVALANLKMLEPTDHSKHLMKCFFPNTEYQQ